MNTYYYFNNPKFPIYVTDKTIEITPYTFNKNGHLWEQQSLYQFFSKIDNKNYNIVDIIIIMLNICNRGVNVCIICSFTNNYSPYKILKLSAKPIISRICSKIHYINN
jgi:hypothetical protein